MNPRLLPATFWAPLTVLLAASSVRAQDGADEVVRPFDKIVLKNGNTTVGTIQGDSSLETATEIELVTPTNSRLKLKADTVESIVPRQTAEDVYRLKARRVEAIKEGPARARAELDLGRWCRAPLAELDGASPRPEAAQQHLLNAVELDASLREAYPHLLAVIAEQEQKGPLEPAAADIAARIATLAVQGAWEDLELDVRAGRHLATVANLPGAARQVLERALARPVTNQSLAREARALLETIYVEQNLPELAIALHEKSLVEPASSPANFAPLLGAAKLHARLGTEDGVRRARELLTGALALQPDDLEAAAELAALDYREGKLPAAEKALKAIVSKDTNSMGAAIDLAIVSFRLGKVASAVKALGVLAPKAEGSDRARAHLVLGLASEASGNATAASSNYEAALAADATLVEAVLACGMHRVREGDAGAGQALAEALLAQSATSRPLFAAASRLAGEAELAAGRPQEALLHLLRAVEVDTDDAALHERVGLLLLGAGRLDAAYPHLERARTLGGDRPDTINGLGYYHYTRGDQDTALKHFESVLKLVPASARTAKAAPTLPPARRYALESKAMIEDLRRLEVWSADLAGADAATLDGWTEVERFGVEVSRKDGRIVLAGQQSGEAEGVTLALLDRPVEASSFERLALTARVDAGKARLGLRLEGVSAKGGASTGLIFYKDFDGVLRCQLKSAQGDWEPLPRTEGDALPGKVHNPETTSWPQDGGYHTLEVRRSGRLPGATSKTATSSGFDLFLDGQPVALNIRVTGMTGRSYDVGFSGQTDAVGNEYTISVQGFKVFRLVPEKKKHAKF